MKKFYLFNDTFKLQYYFKLTIVCYCVAADVIGKKATTHLSRTDVACRQKEAGVPHDETKVFMGFEHTTATDIYMRGSFHVAAMLPAVGWDNKESFFCWWESSGRNIPQPLLDAVMPGLDNLSNFAKYVQQKVGGDASAVAVCEVLKYLRGVYIEDAVYRQSKYPLFPAYQHAIFKFPPLYNIFIQYAAAERKAVYARQQQYMEKDANIHFKLNFQAQAIDSMSSKLLDLEALLIGGGSGSGGAGGSSSGAGGGSSSGAAGGNYYPLPALPDTIDDLFAFYTSWNDVWRAQINDHKAVFKKGCQWQQQFGEAGKALGQRYHHYVDFLNFVDSFDKESIPQLLADVVEFGAQRGLTITKLVKKVYYHMARPHTSAEGDVEPHIEVLQQFLHNRNWLAQS